MISLQQTLFSVVKTENILRSGTIQGCLLSPLFFNIILKVLDTAVREEKEVKGIQIRKEEVNLSLFPDDMILYIENPKDCFRKLLELSSELSKVAGYKINTQKSLSFYILAMKNQKEKLNLLIEIKRTKYLGINLPKEKKELYTENYKTLMK